MKDTKLCARCKYHGYFGAKPEDGGSITNVMCDYSGTAHDGTCLKRVNGELIDRRGSKFDECLLFVEGKRVERREPEKVHRSLKNLDRI